MPAVSRASRRHPVRYGARPPRGRVAARTGVVAAMGPIRTLGNGPRCSTRLPAPAPLPLESPAISLGGTPAEASGGRRPLELTRSLSALDALACLLVELLRRCCRSAPLAEIGDHHADALLTTSDRQLVPHPDPPARLGSSPRHLHMAARDRVRGERSRSEEACGPEPAIESDTLLHLRGCSQPAPTRVRRPWRRPNGAPPRACGPRGCVRGRRGSPRASAGSTPRSPSPSAARAGDLRRSRPRRVGVCARRVARRPR